MASTSSRYNTKPRRITVQRWPSRCRDCGYVHQRGAEVLWTPGHGVTCADTFNCRIRVQQAQRPLSQTR